LSSTHSTPGGAAFMPGGAAFALLIDICLLSRKPRIVGKPLIGSPVRILDPGPLSSLWCPVTLVPSSGTGLSGRLVPRPASSRLGFPSVL
jgi:hypothetical protein